MLSCESRENEREFLSREHATVSLSCLVHKQDPVGGEMNATDGKRREVPQL